MQPKLSFRSLLVVHGLSIYLCYRLTIVLINYVYYKIYTQMQIVKRSIKDKLFSKFHIYVLVYCIGVFLSVLLHSV